VKVVVHQAVGVAHPVEAPTDITQQSEPLLAVCIVKLDGLAPVTARGNVEQAARDFNA